VQEKTERSVDAEAAQLRAKRHEMIILDPEQGVGGVEAQ
jgi:hypothetical protein